MSALVDKLICSMRGVAFATLLTSCSGTVAIESLESKTVEGGPVYNTIRYISGEAEDIWMMNQNHYGLEPGKPWDRLAIVVNKTTSPKTAKFYQLKPGELVWTGKPELIQFRVSCFFCHNNGPRAIRPKGDSPSLPLSISERAKIAVWNLKIKSYGRVVPHGDHEKQTKEVSFRQFKSHAPIDNDVLAIESCAKCHRDGSDFFARGALRRQQALTISYMVEAGHMPPLGFSLTDSDREKLNRFLEGF